MMLVQLAAPTCTAAVQLRCHPCSWAITVVNTSCQGLGWHLLSRQPRDLSAFSLPATSDWGGSRSNDSGSYKSKQRLRKTELEGPVLASAKASPLPTPFTSHPAPSDTLPPDTGALCSTHPPWHPPTYIPSSSQVQRSGSVQCRAHPPSPTGAGRINGS